MYMYNEIAQMKWVTSNELTKLNVFYTFYL